MKLKVGEYYRTYGGWKAVVVWMCAVNGVYVIHHPGDIVKESCIVLHRNDGKTATTFAVNDPPQYNSPHPADLIEAWKEIEENKELKRLRKFEKQHKQISRLK